MEAQMAQPAPSQSMLVSAQELPYDQQLKQNFTQVIESMIVPLTAIASAPQGKGVIG